MCLVPNTAVSPGYRPHENIKTLRPTWSAPFLGCQSETPPHCIQYVSPRQREWALHTRYHLLCPRDHPAHGQWTGLFSPRVKVSPPIEPKWTVAQTTQQLTHTVPPQEALGLSCLRGQEEPDTVALLSSNLAALRCRGWLYPGECTQIPGYRSWLFAMAAWSFCGMVSWLSAAPCGPENGSGRREETRGTEDCRVPAFEMLMWALQPALGHNLPSNTRP